MFIISRVILHLKEKWIYNMCSSHSTSTNACGVWGASVRVQVSKKELYTHIHLD